MFLTPLADGRRAVGVVARVSGDAGLLAHFFDLPDLQGVIRLRPKDAVAVARLSDLYLMGDRGGRRGTGTPRWTVIDHLAGFVRSGWPVPVFFRLSGLGPRLITYDDDARNEVKDAPALDEDHVGHPRDTLWGAGAAEIVLAGLIRPAVAA